LTNIHILYGQDDFSVKEAVSRLKASLNTDGMLESNTVVLDGRRVGFDEFCAICNTVPFLSSVRLVIVEGLFAKFESNRQGRSGRSTRQTSAKAKSASDGGEWAGLAGFLPQMAPTTVLVFVDGAVQATNSVFKAIRDLGNTREFPPLPPGALAGWITDRATSQGASFSSGAVRLLAQYVGNDLWQLSSEVDKLALYARGRTVAEDDVRALVSATIEVNVFSLVDAVVGGRREDALRHLHQLFQEGGTAPQLLGTLSTQYRRLILARELMETRTPTPEIGRRLGITSDFALRKVAEQASHYSMSRLEGAYRSLLNADVAIKTGALDEELSLELLVDDLCAAAR
jgi:DNA polymerase-3 subunit delta